MDMELARTSADVIITTFRLGKIMSKSAIYATNTTSTSVASGGTVPLSTVNRRFGCSVGLQNNAITLKERGYYNVDVNFTAVATATGSATLTLYQDGQAIPGAETTVTVGTVGDSISLPINALVRMTGCCCNTSALTLVVSGQSLTVTNVGIVVDKI